MVGCLNCWIVGWLDGWMVGWLDGWMVGWFIKKVIFNPLSIKQGTVTKH